MTQQEEGIIWIGLSVLLLIALVDYLIEDVHVIWAAGLIGFSIGYTVRRMYGDFDINTNKKK